MRLAPFALLVFFICLAVPAGAEEKVATAPVMSDTRILVPAGVVGAWKLRLLEFNARAGTYDIRRHGRLNNQLASLRVIATRQRPEIPAFMSLAMGQTHPDPIKLDRTVFIRPLRRTLRFYHRDHGGGPENDIYCTEPVAIPDGRGGTLFLVIEAEISEGDPASLLASVRWERALAVARWKVSPP